MLSGLKFIPRDQIDDKAQKDDKSALRKSHKKKKNKSRHDDSSSDEDGSQRIKKRSKKKWYSSDDDSASYSDSGSDEDMRKRKESKKRHKSKKSSRRGKSKRRGYSSNESDDDDDNKGKGRSDKTDIDGNNSASLKDNENIVRKEMGLEWMLRPKEEDAKQKSVPASSLPDEPPADEIKKVNPRELNPYFRNDGKGYPEEAADGTKSRDSNLLSSSVVGDGGASWRLKAMKRSQEQAAREGKKLDEVVKERWGTLGDLAVSVASNSAAPSHAHLHAIKNRIRQQHRDRPGDQDETERDDSQKGMHAKMRVPRRDESLSWGKRRGQSMSAKDAGVISSALSSLQKFSNDGSFLHQFKGSQQQKNDDSSSTDGGDNGGDRRDSKSEEPLSRTDGGDRREVSKSEEPSGADMKPAPSANQLAAKVMQLRMKGKHAEADKLLKEAEVNEGKIKTDTVGSSSQGDGTASRYIMHGLKSRKKNREEDADMHVARSIMQNKKFSISGQADDEYDNDEGPKRKKRGKGDNNAAPKPARFEKRILTQQERCNFCFENPKRPRHLVIAIANFTYMMLPQWQPVVPGHCCILPMQHDLATRSVDDNVWDEIRNFKKCLLMMFAKQEKEVVFLETVMGLAKQSRHCMIECIPLPPEVAKQAPLYFKKAIDEAEEEWSQHNAKKLIDTSEKGLRHSIPPDFPYFHVEFGLKKGYVHVIDDESQFKSSFGVNVVRGMLRLPAEDMHRRHQRDSLDSQKQAVADFRRDWDSFDWTKQLD